MLQVRVGPAVVAKPNEFELMHRSEVLSHLPPLSAQEVKQYMCGCYRAYNGSRLITVKSRRTDEHACSQAFARLLEV